MLILGAHLANSISQFDKVVNGTTIKNGPNTFFVFFCFLNKINKPNIFFRLINFHQITKKRNSLNSFSETHLIS